MATHWRKEVRQKYNNKCYVCGRCDCTTIHHCLPQAKYPSLKMNINNCILLCISCHEYYHRIFINDNIKNCNLETLNAWLISEGLEPIEDVIINEQKV